MWRIPLEINVEHRLKIDGAKPLFAWFDFRLIPSDTTYGIALATAWVDSGDDRWLPAVEEAIKQSISMREDSGRPVSRTTIEMNRVISHPIDTNNCAVTYNMMRALGLQFAKYEVEDQP